MAQNDDMARGAGGAAAPAVAMGDFLCAWGRLWWLYLIGLAAAIAGVYSYSKAQPKVYRATARIELGRAAPPELMIGVSDLAGGGPAHKLDASYATETYDAMRLSVLAESYLKSNAVQAAAGLAPSSPQPVIDVEPISNSGLVDISVELRDPREAARLDNALLNALRASLVIHDFEYLEQARVLYRDELSSETERWRQEQDEYNRLRDAATGRGQTLLQDRDAQRLAAQITAREAWIGQLTTKIDQLALATRPEAEAASVWVRVIQPATPPANPVRPRPVQAAAIAAGLFTFIFLALLALAQVAACGARGRAAWRAGSARANPPEAGGGA